MPELWHGIKLTESLATPLIKATRDEFEKPMNLQSAAVARREQGVGGRGQEMVGWAGVDYSTPALA